MTDDEDATLEEFLDVESGDGGDSSGEEDEAEVGESDGADGENDGADVSAVDGSDDEDDEGEVGEGDDTDGEDDETDVSPVDGSGDGDDVERPTITSRWVPGGAECDRCADATERLWRTGDGAFVCTDCSEWE